MQAMKVKPAELILSLAILVLGIAVAIGTSQLSSAGGYARIGPNVAPMIISGGLILLGAWLSYEALSGGWRNAVPDDPEARGEHRFPGERVCLGERRIDRTDFFDPLCRIRACPGGAVSLCGARFRQRQVCPRFCHRSCPRPRRVSLLRQVLKRKFAGRLARSRCSAARASEDR